MNTASSASPDPALADPVRHIAELVDSGRDLEAESELIGLAGSPGLGVSMRSNLARISLEIGKPYLALEMLEPALRAAPRAPQLHFLAGLAERELGQPRRAIEHFESARPSENPDAAYHLSIAREVEGDLQGALEAARLALANGPQDADYSNQMACVLTRLGRHEEALGFAEQAHRIEPQAPGFAFNLAQNLLLLGRHREGLPLFESRLAFLPGHVFPKTSAAAWTGGPLAGKSLLVWHEQGLGDSIQFCRFLPFLSNLGASVSLRVPAPLAGLLRRALPAVTVFPDTEPVPGTDLHVPLLSLPFFLNLEDPASVPSVWAPLPRNPMPPRRIGICHAGNPRHPEDAQRSIPHMVFSELLGESKTWISLQAGDPQNAKLPASVQAFPAGRGDFLDTEQILRTLDLVITVDTSVAHLSASMGIPTWILLPFSPDWRWGPSGSRTPWYPGATLFRQPSPGDWHSVLAQVAEHLARP